MGVSGHDIAAVRDINDEPIGAVTTDGVHDTHCG
jgi:hypothetical protein